MVECTFGILSSQWRIYKRPINNALETAENIITATIVLHNWLHDNEHDDAYASLCIDTVNDITASPRTI